MIITLVLLLVTIGVFAFIMHFWRADCTNDVILGSAPVRISFMDKREKAIEIGCEDFGITRAEFEALPTDERIKVITEGMK